MIDIIKKRKIWYTLSAALIALTFVGIGLFGVNYGIDFSGGTILEIAYTKERPASDKIYEVLDAQKIEDATVQAIGDKGYILRMPAITEAQKGEVMAKLREQIGQKDGGVQVQPTAGGEAPKVNVSFTGEDKTTKEVSSTDQNQVLESRFDTIGPVVGQALKTRSIESLALIILAILIFMAWAFRKVSWPVKSWKYGVIAVIALFHDVIITFGAYIWFSHRLGFEVDTTFVAALLTVLGYSVNDTIVVFDRVRENLPRLSGNFADIVSASVRQTMSRSINTALCVLLVLVPIFFLGGQSLKGFMFTLIIGVFTGTYSSVCIASPLLVSWQLYEQRKKGK